MSKDSHRINYDPITKKKKELEKSRQMLNKNINPVGQLAISQFDSQSASQLDPEFLC